jgi:hypothetical protein
MVALITSFSDYLAGCHGCQDTFDFPSDEEAKAFETKIRKLATDQDGRVTIQTDLRGTRVVAWLPTRPKERP